VLGLEGDDIPDQFDRGGWPKAKERFAEIFRTKTRDEWCRLFEGADACFTPVLAMGEAPSHPHNQERGTFIEIDGIVQPAPAPRFSRTRPEVVRPPARAGEHTDEVLLAWGFSSDDVQQLRSGGAIR
jgi:alpha-methylacyl-CoA racemase